MYNAGLVLEGGGMKGMYTAGVLDFFLDKGIEFSSVYGVSMGACDMCSYLAKQRDRAFAVVADYAKLHRYFSIESLIFTGNLFNVKMVYDTIPNRLYPFDYETYKNYSGKAYAVATDIETGLPEYFRIKELKADMEKIRASASLPLVSRNVKVDGKLYLDGGISDSIPLKKSIEDGNKKNIVVMTKEVGYIREPIGKKHLALVRALYRKYPKVGELMADRHNMYNGELKYLDEQIKSGGAFLIQPKYKGNVGRIERDRDKLKVLYEQGYNEAAECYDEMKKYLEG